jgi:hypothetical protein
MDPQSRKAVALSNPLRASHLAFALTRAAVLLGVVTFVCVPTLVRIGQGLAPATHGPSFRNIEGPPKKLTIAPVAATISAIPLKNTDTVRVTMFSPAPVAQLQQSPFLSTARPLRAPPSLRFA